MSNRFQYNIKSILILNIIKNINKNIKMKPIVALFKKKSMKLYLLLKAKTQAKAYQHSCTLFA